MLNQSGPDHGFDDSDTITNPETAGSNSASTSVADSRTLLRALTPYRDPDPSRSLVELAISLGPYLALCAGMMVAVEAGYWIALILTIPAGGFLLRLFLIQHDCGHGSFLPSRSANDWLGRFLGVLTLTPYACWRRSHALHHAGTGNLDARGFGDVDTLTVREFQSLSRWRQLMYRAYRHPLVLFGLGPAYLFLLRHRLPVGLMREGRRYWVSSLGTNAATAALAAVAISLTSWTSFLVVQLPVILVAGSIGVWLFYVQHQFEETYWNGSDSWSFHEAALGGSSHLALPPLLRWFTANIGVHHVHHLSSRIPFYRLSEVLRDHPQLVDVNRLTISQTLGTVRLTLWDEEQRKMVGFAEARQLRTRLAAQPYDVSGPARQAAASLLTKSPNRSPTARSRA